MHFSWLDTQATASHLCLILALILVHCRLTRCWSIFIDRHRSSMVVAFCVRLLIGH